MNKLDAEIAAIVKTISAAWAESHPDIPSDRIASAAGLVIGAKLANVLHGLGTVAENDPARVTEITLTIDWVNEMDAGLAATLSRGDA